MKKRRLKKLADLRSGRPTLNNGDPAEWLIAIVGPEAGLAAVLFEAESIQQPDGTTIRLRETPTDTPTHEL
jgi:hypothetical protein